MKKEKDLLAINFNKLYGRGGSSLITPLDKGRIFTKEKFSEEHKMFYQTAQEFAEKSILPVSDDLNVLNKELSLKIFKEMGQLGFLGVDVSEDYGGMSLDKTTACIIVDALASGKNASILVTASAHTGIAMLPLVWYGNDFQKNKYLTKLATGEYMGCYALTEPNAGSDALSGKTTAILNKAGTHYILNGQKIYVTNGGWADISITFASVNGKYTAFILDKDCEGWKIGEEENKLGIKGSSTVTFYYEDCKVPIENVIGKVGEGGPIAFNVLYVGRYKLGVTTAAGSKYILNGALDFANEREQFNKPIAKFDMIKKKFANMVTRIWESETVNYMITGSLDYILNPVDKNTENYYELVQKVIEDHGMEASISKIIGSETLAYVVDEGVQILGGAGFIEEYPMACAYRDERINRIFEGTNEVNRLIIAGTFLKKTILEEIPVRDMIGQRDFDWIPELEIELPHSIIPYANAVEFVRSFTLYCFHNAILKYGQDLKNIQWLIEPLANMLISLCIIDSGFKRYLTLNKGVHKENTLDIVKLSIADNFENSYKNGMDIVNEIFKGDILYAELDKIEKFRLKTKYIPKRIQYQKHIVNKFYQHGKYYLD